MNKLTKQKYHDADEATLTLLNATKSCCTLVSLKIQELKEWNSLQHGKFEKHNEMFDLHLCIKNMIDSYVHTSTSNKIKIKLLNNF